MPLLKTISYAQTNVTLPAEIPRAPCLLGQRTHATPPSFSFVRPMLGMLYFQLTELGCHWTWSTPWSATNCHIFLLRMVNQFATVTYITVRHYKTPRRAKLYNSYHKTKYRTLSYVVVASNNGLVYRVCHSLSWSQRSSAPINNVETQTAKNYIMAPDECQTYCGNHSGVCLGFCLK